MPGRRWVGAAVALAGAVVMIAPAPRVGAVQDAATVVAAARSAPIEPAAAVGGDAVVTVGYVVIGDRLRLHQWPLRPGTTVDIRIDVWVAPNAGWARLVQLTGDGVIVPDCARIALQVGAVNRVQCDLVVPVRGRGGDDLVRAWLRIHVSTPHGTVDHSFLLLIQPPADRR